jgi:predicted nucleic acid-binding protein
MKYLFDTNVISEIRKQNCNPRVKAFVSRLPFEELCICSLTLGEIFFGIEKLPACKKKHELTIWLFTELLEHFKGRVIPLDQECMLEWGKLCAMTGRTLPAKDSLIAAAAIRCRLVLITRNTKDFEDIPGLELINPWEF